MIDSVHLSMGLNPKKKIETLFEMITGAGGSTILPRQLRHP
jgi:hypothetical protein